MHLYIRRSAFCCKVVALLMTFLFFAAFFPVESFAYYENKVVLGAAPERTHLEQTVSNLTVELSTGTVLNELQADDAFAATPELVMLMNALVVAEKVEDLDSEVSVQMNTFPFVTDVGNIGIGNGTKVTYRDLLSLMLLCRGQDAASILAIAVSGRYATFLELMNDKANRLGMGESVFTTVNGVYDVEQVISLKDVVRLVSAVYSNADLMAIFALSEYTVSPGAGNRLSSVYQSVFPQNESTDVLAFGSYSQESLALSVKPAEEGAEQPEVPENKTVGIFLSGGEYPVASVTRYVYGTDGAQAAADAAQAHNAIYSGYVKGNTFFIGNYLCNQLSFDYYDKTVKGYVLEDEFADFIFARGLYQSLTDDNAQIPADFALQYKSGYIYSETRKAGDIFTAADLTFQGTKIAVVPIYASDEILVENPFEPKDETSVFQKLLQENNFYIALAAALLLTGVLCFVFLKKRSDGKE